MGDVYSFAHAASLAVMLPYESRIAYRSRTEEESISAMKGEAMSIDDFNRKREKLIGGGDG